MQQPHERSRRVETAVREYANARDFERDLARRTKDGWTIVAQSQGSTHVNWGRTILTTGLTMGLNMLTPKIGGASYTKGKIVVTYRRER